MFSSLEDEMFLGYPESVGVIQLYDRQEKIVDDEEFSRIFYMRKLLGSMIVRAQCYAEAFQTTLGLKVAKNRRKEMKNKAVELLHFSDLNNDTSMASFKPYFRQILQTFKKANKESKKDSENAAKELASLEKFEKERQR